MHIKAIVVLLAVFGLSYALPYGDDNNDIYSNDDYEDGNEGKSNPESIIHTIPEFSTEPMNSLVNEGSTIRLPCIVDRLEGFVLLWKHGEEILAVAQQVIDKSGRIRVEPAENGNYLVISFAEESDAGNYTCQISTYKPNELHHAIKIRVRPEVAPVPESGLIVTETGSTVTLGCQVTKGNPAPEVTWHRRERKMPSGEESIRGLSITYTSVTRHHSGVYVCQADNGFGEPSTTTLKLDVQHAPEIDQEETFIHTGAGDETEVICVIHSSPKPTVTWLKDGIEIQEGQLGLRAEHLGNRHTLHISDVKEEHFGQYTCKAENRFGAASQSTLVSGLAGDVNFKSDPKGENFDRYQLEWVAQSSSPITHFKVAYRPEGTSNRWVETEVKAVNMDRQFYTGDITLTPLNPRQVYVAKVASKNSYGYNGFGKEFKFATKGGDPVQKPITGGAPNLFQSSPILLICALLAQRWL